MPDDENKKTKDDTIDEETYELVNARKQKLFCKSWKPAEEKVRCIVFLSHGFTEHCQFLSHVAESLVKKVNAYVVAHDHVGHGKSEGSRAQIKDGRHYVADVFQHCEYAREKYPELPIYYMGHSMGGLIGLTAGLERSKFFNGMILVASLITVAPEVAGKVKMFLANVTGKAMPNLKVLPPPDYATGCRDEEVVKEAKEDVLHYHGKVKAGWSRAMIVLMKDLQKNFDKVDWPVLILHGDADKVCDVQGSKILYEKCASPDRTLKIYQEAWHCLFFEPNGIGEKSVTDAADWIKERIV